MQKTLSKLRLLQLGRQRRHLLRELQRGLLRHLAFPRPLLHCPVSPVRNTPPGGQHAPFWLSSRMRRLSMSFSRRSASISTASKDMLEVVASVMDSSACSRGLLGLLQLPPWRVTLRLEEFLLRLAAPPPAPVPVVPVEEVDNVPCPGCWGWSCWARRELSSFCRRLTILSCSNSMALTISSAVKPCEWRGGTLAPDAVLVLKDCRRELEETEAEEGRRACCCGCAICDCSTARSGRVGTWRWGSEEEREELLLPRSSSMVRVGRCRGEWTDSTATRGINPWEWERKRAVSS